MARPRWETAWRGFKDIEHSYMLRIRHTLIIIALVAAGTQCHAQQDDEYLMEIGAGVGMMNYLGDFNGNLTKDMEPMASLVVRRNFSARSGLKLNVTYGKMKGCSDDVDTYYPDLADNPVSFDNTLIDFSLTFEYNFFPYGTGRDVRGAKRLTPFIFLGIGGTYADTEEESVFTGNFPIGLGAKYKIGKRLNLGVEWAMHFSLSDKLDNIEDPYTIESSGAFKNTDCYSTFMVTLTYSFLAKCTTCNKDE